MLWDWVLFISIVSVCVLIVVRSVRRNPSPFSYRGLLWFRQGKTFWGPCCKECAIQFYLRPVFQNPGARLYYELVCPLCQQPLAGLTFTLEALLDLEKEVTESLRLRRVGESLTAALKASYGVPQ